MSVTDLVVREQYVATVDGWALHLRRTLSQTFFDPRRRPLLIVPGYGMNTFIFGFHPRGTSLERCLAEAGYEVWSVNLRGMGHSRRERSDAPPPSLLGYSLVDVPAAIDRVLEATRTESKRLTLIGASLGGTITYGYLALRDDARVAELVTMGAPLRWVDIHPAVRVAFASPALAGALRLNGTRAWMRRALPVLARAPVLLSMYMNTATIDRRQLYEMTRTVEDPDPSVNRDIALWLRGRDLVLDGVNVTEALRRLERPLMVVLSNRDGIVPERTALSVLDAWGGDEVEVLRVGSEDNWYAHANLFVADDAPALVFDPIIAWLRRRVA